MTCLIHGDNCPGDSGHMFIDMNHPDAMYPSLGPGPIYILDKEKWMAELREDQIKHFESGASSSGDLPPYECLTPLFLHRTANRMKLGLRYGKHNWKKGIRDKQFILDRLNHAFVHLIKAMEEIDRDHIPSDDNLAAVAVNCMFAMEYEDAHFNPDYQP
jgi:hypothetical protein